MLLTEKLRVDPRTCLVIILALGVFLRIYHLNHGLPDVVYVDSFKFVGEASRIAASGDLQPKDYQYPGLYTNLLVAIYSLFHIETKYAHHLSAALISALAGSGLVAVVFAAARLLSGNFGALLAASLSVFCITSISLSRIPAPDILMGLFMTASIYAMLQEKSSIKMFLFAGVFAGLSAGSKFTGFYVLIWLPIAALIADGPKSVKKISVHLFISYLAFAATFILTTPWFLPKLNFYLERMLAEFQRQRYGQIGAVQGGYFDYVFSSTTTWAQPWMGTSLITNIGIPMTLAGAIALLWGITQRRSPRVLFLAAFIATYVALISGPGKLKAFRFMFPVLPLLYILIGCFIEKSILGRLKRFRMVTGLALAALLLIFPVFKTMHYLGATNNPTTNETAKDWIGQNISPGTKAFRGPFFLANLDGLPINFVFIKNVGGRLYRLPEGSGPNPERSPIFYPELIDELRNSGVQIVIMNSYFDDAFSPVPENIIFFPRSVQSYQKFLERLKSEAHLDYSVKGWSDHRTGPDITVYRLL